MMNRPCCTSNEARLKGGRRGDQGEEKKVIPWEVIVEERCILMVNRSSRAGQR